MQTAKFPLISLLLFLFCAPGSAQERPRLVIGITVDQMRYDYLYRYWEDMSDAGLKRMLREGHVAHDGHYHYAPTYTGPGHASIYTGTGPAMHGIVGNNWYSRADQRRVYCAGDDRAKTVGSDTEDGKMSPHRLTATTLADQLELATNRRSKTIGIAIKDRGAVLPVGFLADGAYWFDKTVGRFITSDYYRDTLPAWVQAFNERGLPDQYFEQGWSLLLPLERYDESLPDDKPYERPFKNTDRAVFPYDFKAISARRSFGQGETPYGLVTTSPHGNTLTFEFAKAAIEGEDLGQDDIPDLLALSFSSPDYAGHQFGPHSVEIQDVYLRFDRELADFFHFIDRTVGLKYTLIFLTADHGGADVPGYVMPPAGYFQEDAFEEGLRRHLSSRAGQDPVEFFINEQIYFKRGLKHSSALLETWVREYAETFPGVLSVIPLNDIRRCSAEPTICEKIRKGWMPGRSGDLYLQLLPGWIAASYEKGGTTHGSPYAHDTHVPIIFFGSGVAPHDNYSRVWIEDIAPTVSAILKIAMPSGCTGRPVEELFQR